MGAPLGKAHAVLRNRRARLAAEMAERLPQGIQLRRAGRMRTELKALKRWSEDVAKAGVRHASLAAIVRAFPEAGAGCAAALVLGTCVWRGLDVPEAVAALTALAMVTWPLQQLADVADRRRAFLVAAEKLDHLLATPRIPKVVCGTAFQDAPAAHLEAAELPSGQVVSLRLERGEIRRLSEPLGIDKSSLLLALAGFEMRFPARHFEVFGKPPGALKQGQVLYLGRRSAGLAGSLRRDVILGIGRVPDDVEITRVLESCGLGPTVARLGGLDGKVHEGRRNLTTNEQVRLLLARGLLARPALALIDADDVGFDQHSLAVLLDHLANVGAAGLVNTSDPEIALRLGSPGALSSGTVKPAHLNAGQTKMLRANAICEEA